MRKILAFTLAEMLIVISVIGIVSAIALPNLNHSTHQTANKSKLKKFYAEMTDAWGRMEGVYGKYENWSEEEQYLDFQESKQPVLMERLQDFLKVKRVAIENSRVRQMQTKDWFYYANDGYVFYARPIEENSFGDDDDYDDSHDTVEIRDLNYGGKIIKCYGQIRVTTEPELRKTQQNTSLQNYVKRYVFYITEEGLIPAGSQGIVKEDGSTGASHYGDTLEEQYNNCIKLTYAVANCTGPLVEY